MFPPVANRPRFPEPGAFIVIYPGSPVGNAPKSVAPSLRCYREVTQEYSVEVTHSGNRIGNLASSSTPQACGRFGEGTRRYHPRRRRAVWVGGFRSEDGIGAIVPRRHVGVCGGGTESIPG